MIFLLPFLHSAGDSGFSTLLHVASLHRVEWPRSSPRWARPTSPSSTPLSMDSSPPRPGSCRQRCSEHCGACTLLDLVFLRIRAPEWAARSCGGCVSSCLRASTLGERPHRLHPASSAGGSVPTMSSPAFTVCGFDWLCVPVWGLCCRAGFSVVRRAGLPTAAGGGGFACCGAWPSAAAAPGCWSTGSVVVARVRP